MEEFDLFNQPAQPPITCAICHKTFNSQAELNYVDHIVECSKNSLAKIEGDPAKPVATDLVSLAEGREYIRNGRKEGVTCPCCGQLAKAYNRQIHSTIAKMLIRIYLLWKSSIRPDQYHHLSAIIDGISATGINDFSKLAYWGLIEEKPRDPENSVNRTSGYWKITEKGINFVRGTVTVQKYAVIYDNRVLEFRGEQVNIIQCLGKRFSYEELMNANS
jgi:hypothetical protein